MDIEKARETPTLTRRLAAVWFADIVGFTRLASQDEVTALRLVELFQEVARAEIDRHGGTLVKFTGDGLLAHADSTAAAVDAALSLRERFDERSGAEGPAAQLRIGIHVGDIVLSPDGDVYGDGVNVAARLQAEAEPGAVVVSEDVWRHCRQLPELRFTSLGEVAPKGLDVPLSVYTVSSQGDANVPPAVRDPSGEGIAILPFEVLGRSDDAEFLAAGIHNDLISGLSRTAGLTVISRTSVMGYRNTDKPIRRIARELGAGAIVEGTVQSAGHRIRLTVQLIDGRRDVQLWAQHYDDELTTDSIFSIQTALTRRIVESLHAELVPRQAPSPDRPPTGNLDAYRLAAEGRMHSDLRSEASLERAIDLFEKAVELDPGFGLAWAGLAGSLALMEDYGHGDSEALLSRAEEAVRRAIDLSPESAETRTSLGLLLATEQDGPGAIREFQTAIHLGPSHADAHSLHGWLCLLTGQNEPALASSLRAVELNPLSAEAVNHLALSHLAVGDPGQALAEARRAGRLSLAFTTTKFYEAIVLFELGQFDEARSILEPLSLRATGRGAVPWAGMGPDATLALAEAGAGRIEQAEAILATIDPEAYPFATGLVLAGMGRADEAFASFGRLEVLSPWPTLAVHHGYRRVWDRLLGDPGLGHLRTLALTSWKMDPRATDQSR